MYVKFSILLYYNKVFGGIGIINNRFACTVMTLYIVLYLKRMLLYFCLCKDNQLIDLEDNKNYIPLHRLSSTPASCKANISKSLI